MDDLTLDEIRLKLAPAIADAAIFDGWSDQALMSAAKQSGIDPEVACIAFTGGAMDMIAAWIGTIDQRMADDLTPERLATMPIRERIRTLVQYRLDAVKGQEEALRRALIIQAMPQNVARAVKFGWSSADLMWRLAGDKATDYNHYTKRTILAGIYGATLAVFIDDESPDKSDTRAFLERRINGVMQFEKAKAQFLKPRDRFSVTRFLGRLRYPAR
ncbi:COQ9 family protein [Altererythrobacter indicus]|uniref:COQ9 family protein n=1 Tax=Altericroceibacterium indicum TaxID=374177 RepID=A0A845AG10_9SPHN|nr:COQ9 family protein [Altericroceibacterium indicum]MXP26078.1 COQ9 family protein [Altericroceibacterium indicum]